jgi:cell division protein ZapA (FtsZ GTPase activity inhibitor)
MSGQGQIVPVEIDGQRYPIRTALDPAYVTRLAAYVEEKMRAASDRCRQTSDARDGQIAERAGEIERLLDRMLLS